MDYSKLVGVYTKLEATTKRLEKTKIISSLLSDAKFNDLDSLVYLLQGRVFPKWDSRKLGMSSKLVLKSINIATGVSIEEIERMWINVGDLGTVAEDLLKEKKQATLVSNNLTVEKVIINLRKLSELSGNGAVSKKIDLVNELINSASPKESKFIIRTIIEKLRLSVAEGVIRDSIVWTYFPKVEGIFIKCIYCQDYLPPITKCLSCNKKIEIKACLQNFKKSKSFIKIEKFDDLNNYDLSKYSSIFVNSNKLGREIYNYFVKLVQDSYNITNDFGQVVKVANKHNFSNLKMSVGRPLNPMLAIKSESISDALKSVGSPALVEAKLDGFRLQIHKDNNKINFYTRRLENVTTQFSELVPLIKSNVKSKFAILDSEVVGYDPESGKHLPFQFVSQRIRRKYNIEKKSKEIPVEINVFDVMYNDGRSCNYDSQKERRELLEKIIITKDRNIVLTKKLVSSDESKISKFYRESLSLGNEGIMIKNLNGDYIPGRKVGSWVKIKPIKETLDLVITSAEWGEGKRKEVLSSFTLSCRDKNKLFEIGKVGTGILEKGDGLTFIDLTKDLVPLIISKKGKKVILRPEIILEIAYEEIQKSVNYSSGYALRFPRVVRLRSDLGFKGIDKLDRVKTFFKKYLK